MKQETQWNSRRRFLAGSISVAVAGLFTGVRMANASPENKVKAKARLGINLAGIADWNTEQPFANFFHMSREWISQKKNAGWGKGPALDLDENGWIKSLPAGAYATRIICSLDDGNYPSGEYVILYDGEGDLKVSSGVGRMVDKSPGRMVALVNAKKGAFFIEQVKTNPENYMRNIRVIAPGYEKTYSTNPWRKEFLGRWSGVACLRFMDFMKTNHSEQKSWSDRPKIEDAGFTKKGVPVEVMVDLANRLKTDAWFCLPHAADDDYVKSFATYVKATLRAESKAYVEYSNELWNGMFSQSKYASELGSKLGLASKSWEAAWLYTGHRSAEIFDIWDGVYGTQSNFVKVLASQAGNSYVSSQILKTNNAGEKADVLAIAPYVSFNVTSDQKQPLNEKNVEDWSLDKLFNYLTKAAIPESTSWIEAHKKEADKYGLKLVAYEGGQHLIGILGVENNKKITKLLFDANEDKRMGEIYTQNLDAWKAAGGDLFCQFDSMSRWSQWGNWGLLRNNSEDPKSSPKFTAVIDWAKKQGQAMHY